MAAIVPIHFRPIAKITSAYGFSPGDRPAGSVLPDCIIKN
jgi:hypothetical protein